MVERSSVFERTYKDYLAQIALVNFRSIETMLGIRMEGDDAVIPFFGESYRVSEKGIRDPYGKTPSFEKCIILSKYLLLSPDVQPGEDDWVSYRDLKDSGPLIGYFENEAERKIIEAFTGRVAELEASCMRLGGYLPDIQLSYALSMQFDPLPRVPLLLLFNDEDDEFPASCCLLFERRAERYLDNPRQSGHYVPAFGYLRSKNGASYSGTFLLPSTIR